MSLLYSIKTLFAYKDFFRAHCGPIFKIYQKIASRKQDEAFHQLKGKRTLEVAFFLTIPGMWKSDYLYDLMKNDERFHPYIVIFPYSVYKGLNDEELLRTLKNTESFIAAKGFEYLIPYDSNNNKWIDIRKTHNPDVVFFTTPYKDMFPKYYIYNYFDKATCYIPYGFSSLNIYHINYDLIFHNIVGMHFVETDIHKTTAKLHSRNKGENIFVSGYLGTEVYMRNDYIPKNIWKSQSKNKKKVIWAPHHTIGDTFNISNFLKYYNQMLALATKYQDDLQFAFKPHQLLKFKLIELWGKEKTEQYYHKWEEMDNTQLIETDYVDLFITSDAMIHDCGSFTSEYLHTKKPVMYLVKENVDPQNQFSDFGNLSFSKHYHGYSIEDIENFLQNVVISGDDPLMEERKLFFDNYLYPKDGIMPSQKVINLLMEKIYSD